jgi:pyruvate-ferredoxin/flavodoxin oxidoreductase
LRIGPKYIGSHYLITDNADYIQVTKLSFVKIFDMINPLKKEGTFLLNCPYTTNEELENNLPPRMLKQIAEKKLKFYVIDANKIAKDVGMAKRTNTVM